MKTSLLYLDLFSLWYHHKMIYNSLCYLRFLYTNLYISIHSPQRSRLTIEVTPPHLPQFKDYSRIFPPHHINHTRPHYTSHALTTQVTPSLRKSRPHYPSHALTTQVTPSLPKSRPHYASHALTTQVTPSLHKSRPHYPSHALITQVTPSLPKSRPLTTQVMPSHQAPRLPQFKDYCRRQTAKISEQQQRKLDLKHKETLDERDRKLQAFEERRAIENKIQRFQDRVSEKNR